MTTLNKTMRREIVSSVMADLPKLEGEQAIRDMVLKAAVERLPPKVRAVWDDPKLRGFIETSTIYEAGIGVAIPVHGDDFWAATRRAVHCLGEEGAAAFSAAVKEYRGRAEERSAVRERLEQALSAVRTVKQFREAYPELAKYAPDDVTPVRNLPATTDLMEKLKAAGLKPEAE